MSDESIDLRWRRQGYTVDDEPKAKLRRRLTRKKTSNKKPQITATAAKNRQFSDSAGASKIDVANAHANSAGIESEVYQTIRRRTKVSASGDPARARQTAKYTAKPASSGTPTGVFNAGTSKLLERRQRCVVKVNYVRHGSSSKGRSGSRSMGAAPLKAHARYLEREGAGASDPFGQGYLTRHGQDMFGKDGKKLGEWQSDRHHFRLVISPEHAGRLDMQAFTTSFMQELELKLYQSKSASAPLEWAAVTHHNTDYPHSHVVLRGKTQDGQDLVIPKKMIAHGMRELARELATRELGYRLHHEVVQDLKRQITMERLTELDTVIAAKARAAGKSLAVDPVSLDEYDRARLDWLVEHGYAVKQQNASGAVLLTVDFTERLRAKGEEHDVVRSLQRRSVDQAPLLDPASSLAGGTPPASRGTETKPIHRYRKSFDTAPLLGQVILIEPLDELTDKFAALVRDTGGQSWLVELSQGQADRLQAGDHVKVSATRNLPNGKTTRSPFIRIENLAPPMAPAKQLGPSTPEAGLINSAVQALASGVALTASPPRSQQVSLSEGSAKSADPLQLKPGLDRDQGKDRGLSLDMD